MGMWHDHEMTVIVGIAIQHHKGRLPAPENQVLGILLCTEFLTKDATRRFITQNIGHTPRRPDDIGHAPAPLLPYILYPASIAPTHCSRSAWKMPCSRGLSGLRHKALLWCSWINEKNT